MSDIELPPDFDDQDDHESEVELPSPFEDDDFAHQDGPGDSSTCVCKLRCGAKFDKEMISALRSSYHDKKEPERSAHIFQLVKTMRSDCDGVVVLRERSACNECVFQ